MKKELLKDEWLTEKEKRNLHILDTIRRGGQVSKADIGKMTGLNVVTITNYVNSYIKKALIQEVGLDISTGGRRPELLRLNPDYGYFVGVDLGSPHVVEDTFLVAVVTDITGKIKNRVRIKKEVESQHKFMERVELLIAEMIEKSSAPKDKIKSVGLGIWGVLDRFKGHVRYAVEDGTVFSYANMQKKLEDKFKIPTIVEHDAMLAALGEKWSGIGLEEGVKNILYICSDSSCGMIIKGELYYGATKNAGELNINPPVNENASDTRKCWESYRFGCCMRSRGIDLGIPTYATSYFREHKEVKSAILDMVNGKLGKITFKVVCDAAKKRDKIAVDILKDAGDYLGAKIAYLVNLLSPEVIVIGRGIEKAGDIFFDAVRESVNRWAYEEAMKVVKIMPTTLGDEAVAVGAAALAVQRIFANEGVV